MSFRLQFLSRDTEDVVTFKHLLSFEKCKTQWNLTEFLLNDVFPKQSRTFIWVLFLNGSEFSDKNIFHYSKRARTCHQATPVLETRMLPQHQQDTCMWETGSSNWAQFMLKWYIRFPELLIHLGKTPLISMNLANLKITGARIRVKILSVTYVLVVLWEAIGLLHKKFQVRIMLSIATDFLSLNAKNFAKNISGKLKRNEN